MKKNTVSHFEIYAEDVDKLAQFYTSLFDWTIKPMPGMDYRLVSSVDTDEKGMPQRPGGINGGMLTRPAGFGAQSWISYVMVESIEGTVERAKKLGASVTKDKTAVPGMGWFAMMIDPQGNHFAVFQEDSAAK